MVGRYRSGAVQVPATRRHGSSFFSTYPMVERAEGSGSVLGGPWFPRHPPPWITEGPLAVIAAGWCLTPSVNFWEKGGILFLKPKIKDYKVLPNGVFIPHV